MDRPKRRPGRQYRPFAEPMEGRLVLSAPNPSLKLALFTPPGQRPIRPNTPVLPYGASNSQATFIDPTVLLVHPTHILIGFRDFIAPYAQLNANGAGFIKIGTGSTIQDNATVIANPQGTPTAQALFIGDAVVIGPGATVEGASHIGAYGKAAMPTMIGTNALIDGATIEPGAIVGTLAKVGPGVTVPSGYYVEPGADVETDAEASNPALGKVAKVTTAQTSNVTSILSNNVSLAAGYATLYQGNSATGASPGTTTSGVYSGDLAAVEGASSEPGPTTASFEPSAASPAFPAPLQPSLVQAQIPTFPARMTGADNFSARARQVAANVGRRDSIRADEGQPFTFVGAPQLGNGVTIHAPVSGKIAIGTGVQVFDNAVILAGSTAQTVIGNNVTIGPGAVVNQSTIGAGSSIGARSYVNTSVLPPGSVIPPGTIYVSNKVTGTVEW